MRTDRTSSVGLEDAEERIARVLVDKYEHGVCARGEDIVSEFLRALMRGLAGSLLVFMLWVLLVFAKIQCLSQMNEKPICSLSLTGRVAA